MTNNTTTNFKTLVRKMVTQETLEQAYGHQSCIDFPKQYEQMEVLNEEVRQALQEFETSTVLSGHLLGCVTDIAREIANGNLYWSDIYGVTCYSFEEYVETFVTNNMPKQQKETFNSLFYFMNLDQRKEYIEVNYLMNDQYAHCTKLLDYVVRVEVL
jgi:hypothetical protein